jgi:hypothetical protein
MPINKVLYYPDFEPSRFWFRSHLLFYDKIQSVIPERHDYRPSLNISDILDLKPDFFKSLSPTKSDKKFNQINVELFDDAFATIKNNPTKYPPNFNLDILNNGKMEISGGAVFFHDDKLSERMYALLKKYEFIHIESDEFRRDGLDLGDFSVVNRYAADLIVSQIADKMGKRIGLNTITNYPLAFSVNSLNQLHIRGKKQKRTVLTSTIIQCVIPQNIENLSPDQFLNIREEYSDVRKSLQHTTKELAKKESFAECENEDQLRKEIDAISRDFVDNVSALKNTISPELVNRFIPILFGAAGVVCSNFFDEPIRIGGGLASVILTGLSDQFTISEPDDVHIQRRIGTLQNDIEWQSNMRQLLKSGWY